MKIIRVSLEMFGFSVEPCLLVRTTKWGNLVLLSESGLNLLVEAYSCIRTLKDTSGAYNKVELQHRAVYVYYFKWTILHFFLLTGPV